MKRRNKKLLEYVVLIINYLRNRRLGGYIEGLDVYPYLKHLIQLWPGDCKKRMEKMNEVVGMKNCVMVGGVGKRIVLLLKRQEL